MTINNFPNESSNVVIEYVYATKYEWRFWDTWEHILGFHVKRFGGQQLFDRLYATLPIVSLTACVKRRWHFWETGTSTAKLVTISVVFCSRVDHLEERALFLKEFGIKIPTGQAAVSK